MVTTSVSGALHSADSQLRDELQTLAADARGWFLTGTHSQRVRTRDDGDTTHAFDEELQNRLLQFFERSKLPIRFSSEEREDIDLTSDPQLVALIDPLDGSDVAARGYPMCSISVSIIDLEASAPVLSRIAEVFTGHQFAAFRGTATRNDQPIRPSSVEDPHNAFVVSYFASRSRLSKAASDIDKWSAFKLVLDYGGMLDIAKVGSGQCDAMIEATNGMVAREYIGGVHIATAAGAASSTITGAPIPTLLDRDARSDFIVAATPALHERILGLWQ